MPLSEILEIIFSHDDLICETASVWSVLHGANIGDLWDALPRDVFFSESPSVLHSTISGNHLDTLFHDDLICELASV